MKKKILFLITKSNWGGAQRYVYDLATNVPDGFKPVVVFGGTGLLDDKLRKHKVKTIVLSILTRDVSMLQNGLSAINPLLIVASVAREIRVLFALVRLLKNERPDVLHLNSSKAAGLGALAGRLCGVKKIVFTAHGWPFLETRSYLARMIIWLLSWITALLAHNVILVSDFDLRTAQRMPFIRHKTVRIYNGIKTKQAFGDGEVIRNAFPKGVRIIGTIGELNNNKNQRALIEQARNIPDMYVAIIGEGENRTMLKELVERYNLKQRVKLFGFMPAQDVLKGFDVFALPSLKEGLPYALLEARLAGLPIEANRVGGVGEILDAKDIDQFSLDFMLEKTFALYNLT